MKNIALFGGNGAIAQAFAHHIKQDYPDAALHIFARTKPDTTINGVTYHTVDYTNEDHLAHASHEIAQSGPLDLAIVAIGLLHGKDIMPEKSLRDLSASKFQQIFEANTIAPALIAKHFVPTLNRKTPSYFACLSARVGSISDNQLGGWYAYRSSKAALNMILKNTSIETARRNKHAVIVGLHPGTVDSGLSKPFQGNVAPGKLFTPLQSARYMLDVLLKLGPEQSGRCFAWDGKEISP